jgi:hypothetical protein
MRVVDKAQAKAFAKAEASLPLSVRQRLRSAFTVRGLPFFEFYVQLQRIQAGEPVPSDIKPMFKRMMNRLIQIKSPLDKKGLSPVVINQIAEARTTLNVLLTRLVSGRTDDTMTWMKVNQIFVPLIISVARDKGVYLKPLQKGIERWAIFRRMSAKREKIERLRDNDPESYALMLQKGQLLEEIDAGIIGRIKADWQQDVKRTRLMGRPVIIGKNRYTGEERIYDRDGDVLTHDDFFTKRKKADEWREKGFRAPARMEAPLKDIRLFNDEQVQKLEGDVEYDSITDDKAKQGRLTRIFATKRMPVMIAQSDGSVRVEKVKVIVSGRFKGVYLDDMINSQGRMIEGSEYKLEPMAGRTAQIPRKVDGSWVMVDLPGKTMKKVVRRDVSQREPFVTAADVKTTYTDPDTKRTTTIKEEKLFLKIPGTREYTEIRNAVKALACNTGSKALAEGSAEPEDEEGNARPDGEDQGGEQGEAEKPDPKAEARQEREKARARFRRETKKFDSNLDALMDSLDPKMALQVVDALPSKEDAGYDKMVAQVMNDLSAVGEVRETKETSWAPDTKSESPSRLYLRRGATITPRPFFSSQVRRTHDEERKLSGRRLVGPKRARAFEKVPRIRALTPTFSLRPSSGSRAPPNARRLRLWANSITA